MSTEPVKWSELSDKDKVKLILEHILPYCNVGDDLVVEGDEIRVIEGNEIRTPPGEGERFANYAIAAWDESIQLWRIRWSANKPTEIFDPLHSMTDAWVVYFHAVSKYSHLSDSWKPEESQPFRRFAEILLGDNNYIYDDELYPGRRLFEIVAQWDEIKICKAALAACGIKTE